MGFLFTVGFLDFLLTLLGLYLITQILLPMIFPRDIERNWLFKKKGKKVIDKVGKIAEKKAILNKDIAEAKDELRKTSLEVDKADKELDSIN